MPRVIISTDIGGSDPDDFESMIHAFLAADRFQIEGLISTPTKHDGRTSDIHNTIDAYAKDYANLKTWSSDYPTPAYLKSVTKQGSIDVNPEGYRAPTEGSRLIIEKAHASSEPLWVLAWGAMTDVAQALHDDPSIAGKIKLYSIGAWNTQQDPAARDYVYDNFPDLWWIENNSTFRGMYVNEDGIENNSFQMSDAKGHGALGDLFYQVRPWGIKMGDTPSLLRLIDLDTSNDLDPSAESWGGEFVKTGHGPNYWTDNPDPALKLGSYDGARTVYEDQAQIYKDMVKLFDRAQAPNPDAGVSPPLDSGLEAVNDYYSIDSGQTLWFSARYLTHNDQGDGLKVEDIDDVSAAGVTVRWNSDGSVAYRAPSDWQGTDTLNYTVQDADGNQASAKVFLKVGHGRDPLPGGDDTTPPAPAVTPAETGNPVAAVNDHFTTGAGENLWFNARYLTRNDEGDGLEVVGVDNVSKAGASVVFGRDDWPKGTTVYKPLPGWQGTDSLNYTVRDANGDTDTATVFVQVGTSDLLFV